jgi:predicted dehydrogenase
MRQPLRLGILGAARIAPFAVIRYARKLEGVEVAAVAEEYQSAERLERYARKHRIAQTYRAFDELLANPSIDAVYLPLPISLHAHWCIKAIEAGKHVLCEKPFAANAVEAERVLDASRGTNLVVAEAMHFRYHPLVDRVRQIIRDGEIGSIERIDASLSAYLPFDDFRFHYETGGGGTIDMGCYPIGFIRAVTGEEPTVVGAEAGLHGTLIDRWMRARMRLPSGGDVRLFVGMRCRKLLSVSMGIEGSRGSIRILNFIKPELYHRLTVQSASGRRTERVPGSSTYRAQLEAFVEAVRTGTQPVTTVADAVGNARVIDAVYLAAGLPVRGDEAVLRGLSSGKRST